MEKDFKQYYDVTDDCQYQGNNKKLFFNIIRFADRKAGIKKVTNEK